MISVILAGGKGNRLWPKSRLNCPKQFCKLIDEHSMLDNTITRLIDAGSAKVIIITSDNLLDTTKSLVNNRSDADMIEILSEPEGKNTAPAIGLILAKLGLENPDTVLGIFPADHFIPETSAFLKSIKSAVSAAKKGLLVTIGITPTCPETGYGYIEKDLQHENLLPNVYKVRSFREKPDAFTAQKYIDTGNYLWNSGIYMGQIGVLHAEYAHYLPTIYAEIARGYNSYLKAYDNLPSISLDNGISEKSTIMAVVESSFRWYDLGNWEAFSNLFDNDSEGNCFIGSNILALESKKCLIGQENKTIVLYGVENLLVVEAGDIILVTSREKAQNMRDVTKILQDKGRLDLL